MQDKRREKGMYRRRPKKRKLYQMIVSIITAGSFLLNSVYIDIGWADGLRSVRLCEQNRTSPAMKKFETAFAVPNLAAPTGDLGDVHTSPTQLEEFYKPRLNKYLAQRLGVSDSEIDISIGPSPHNNVEISVIAKGADKFRFSFSMRSDKTIDTYSVINNLDIETGVLAYIALVYNANYLLVREANADEETTLKVLSDRKFARFISSDSYNNCKLRLNVHQLRALLEPSFSSGAEDIFPESIKLAIEGYAGSIRLAKRKEPEFAWPSFAYDVYLNGEKVIPLAQEHFHGKAMKTLPNVLGDQDTYDIVLNVDVIDLGRVTERGIGLAIANFLAHMAKEKGLKLRGKNTAHPGAMKLWQYVTDLEINDAWIKELLRKNAEQDLEDRKELLEWREVSGSELKKGYASFYYTPHASGNAQFSFNLSSQTYVFLEDAQTISPIYYVTFLFDGSNEPKVVESRLSGQGDIDYNPLPLETPISRFNFSPDFTFTIDNIYTGRILAFSEQATIIGNPSPIAPLAIPRTSPLTPEPDEHETMAKAAPTGEGHVRSSPALIEYLDRIPHASESSIKVTIFDLGNVIILFDYERSIEELIRRFGIDRDLIHSFFEERISNPDNPIRKFEEGGLNEEQFLVEVKQWLEDNLQRKIKLTQEDLEEILNKALIGKINEIYSLIRALREKGYKICILTTTNPIFAKHYKDPLDPLEIVSLLEDPDRDFYASYDREFQKPHPRSWLEIIEDNDVSTEQYLFIDDTSINIESAEALGLVTNLFNPQDVLPSIGDIVSSLSATRISPLTLEDMPRTSPFAIEAIHEQLESIPEVEPWI